MRASIVVVALVLVAVVTAASSSVSAAPLVAKNASLGGPTQVIDTLCDVFCGVWGAAGVAGLIGNAAQESSLNPRIHQYDGGPGRGLFQMSVGGLWAVNIDYCRENGCDVWTAEGQAAFVKATIYEPAWEAKSYGSGTALYLRGAMRSASVDATTEAFASHWERCGECDMSNRIRYANEHYGYVRSRCGGAPPSPPGPRPAPPSPPSGGCHQVWPDLCPGSSNCMCSTRAGCVATPLNASHFTNKEGGCAGRCYNVIRDRCRGNNLCVELGGEC